MHWSGLSAALVAFVRDRRANIAVITALVAPVLLAAIGFAADYGYASYTKQALDRGIDAAVLAATSQSAANAGNGYYDLNWLAKYGMGVYQGNTAKLNVSVTPALTVVSNSDGGVTASASYSYGVPTFFSGMMGISTIQIAGTAQATAAPPTYINYYILVDISQSMGLAATTADQANLFARTSAAGNGGCTFGCHVTNGSQTRSNEYLAHNVSPKITLRIDSAVTAIQSIISDAQAVGSSATLKIGLYTMSDDPTTGNKINVISAPTSNYSTLTTLASTIDLGGNTSAGIGDSNFVGQLALANSGLPMGGTGATAASPLNYVFIITDGVSDVPGSCTSGHCTGLFDVPSCTALKLKSRVGVIYTTYLPIYNNNNPAQGYDINYQQLVLPFAPLISPTLQSCASPGLFYQADDGPALNSAMKALFASTLKTARLIR